MNLRNYNIFFHTHTISGIIISLILFVIFFAGSFAFFKPEISSWQKNQPSAAVPKSSIDMNRVRDSVAANMELYGRNLIIKMNERSRRLVVSASASLDTTVEGKGGYFYMDPKNFKLNDYRKEYDLGEFLYRLHFLAPLNAVGGRGFPFGYYVAGLVAFLFLFAIITGILVHWKKIISNFYVFRPWEKLKTLWTDIHTALGVITLPFLFVFALTGAYYLISFPLVTQPIAKHQYNGNTDSLLKIVNTRVHTYPFEGKPINKPLDLNKFYLDAQAKIKTSTLTSLVVNNYGDKSMRVTVSGMDRQGNFTGAAEVVYNGNTGALEQFTPISTTSSYATVVDDLMYTLHFGNFGGNIIRVLYFLLGLAGCIVILSGVMIWLVARNKKNIPAHKRRFNTWLANIYLSISISMYPVTAAVFIAVKLVSDAGRSFIYSFYFWSWLALALLLILRNNNYKTTRDCLLLGSLIGIFVPVINGIKTGAWFWVSMGNGNYDLLLVDLLWTVMSLGTLVTWYLVIRKNRIK